MSLWLIAFLASLILGAFALGVAVGWRLHQSQREERRRR